MKYFILIRNERVLGLFRRYYATDGYIRMEQWDRRTFEWTHAPDLISATGIGGDCDYEEIELSRKGK